MPKNPRRFPNEHGAEWAAVIYTLVTTCRRADVDPFLYLRDVHERISDHPASKIDQLFPRQWKENVEASASAAVEARVNALCA